MNEPIDNDKVLEYLHPSTPRESESWRHFRPLVRVISLLLLSLIVAAIAGARADPLKDSLLMLYAVGVMFFVVFFAVRGRVGKDHLTARARKVVAILAIASLSLNVSVSSCPHARYVCVGPLHFAVSGKACGNHLGYTHYPRFVPRSVKQWIRNKL